MITKKLSIYFFSLIIFSSLILTGGDCSTENENRPSPPGTVAPPEDVNLIVNANPGGGESFARINWAASIDESKTNFRGYRITTYALDNDNDIDFVFEIRSVNKGVNNYTVQSINRNQKYKSVVHAELNDNTQSAFVETPVYGGVYYNNNGSIDSHINENSLSGYGWNIQSGNGNQYLYSDNNSNLIDLHVRETQGMLFFYSPDFFETNYRSTKIVSIGLGQDAFDQTELPEPDKTGIQISDETVYLLKTAEGYYIKIWVRDIIQGSIKFEYKVQPIEGLKVL
jgi:hypothetical protein